MLAYVASIASRAFSLGGNNAEVQLASSYYYVLTGKFGRKNNNSGSTVAML